jgi:geranylgeranyl diphosphate synthase type II
VRDVAAVGRRSEPALEPVPAFEAALTAAIDAAQDRARAAGPAAVALWDAVRDATRGGKRVRPRLLLDTHRALGGTSQAAAERFAVVVELLHTAFCLHDDVIDHDRVRHGRPNVAARYADVARSRGASEPAAATCGVAAGLLAGDLVLTLALRLAATARLDDDRRDAVLDLLDDVVQRSAAGELDDVLAAVDSRAVSLQDVVATAAHKTAEYSVVGPVLTGAILAGASPGLLAALRPAARASGIAYQLGDDLLGMFGDESVTGKSARRDLAEGKVTALVVLARGTSAWPVLSRHLGDPDVTEREAAAVRAALEAAGVRADAEDLVGLYEQTADGLLDDPIVPAALRRTIRGGLTDLVGRAR